MKYDKLKQYILTYTAGDPRIKETLWGEDKRAHDAQAARAISPYFWMVDCYFLGEEQSSGLAATYYWQMTVAIKGATQRGKVVEQELMMKYTFDIAFDFIQFLVSEGMDNNIDFSLSNAQLSPDENVEQAGFYGWDLSFRIGQFQNCPKYAPALGRYQVCSYQATWNGPGGHLAIGINGQVFAEVWDQQANYALILFRLVKSINAAGMNVRAFSDGVYLYIKSTSVSEAFTTDLLPTGNTHTWEGSCTPGKAGSTEPQGLPLGDMQIGSTFIVY